MSIFAGFLLQYCVFSFYLVFLCLFYLKLAILLLIICTDIRLSV